MRIYILFHDEGEGGDGPEIEGIFTARRRCEDLIKTWYAKDHRGKRRINLYIEEHEVQE